MVRAQKNMRGHARDHLGGNIIRQYGAQNRWLKAALEEAGHGPESFAVSDTPDETTSLLDIASDGREFESLN